MKKSIRSTAVSKRIMNNLVCWSLLFFQIAPIHGQSTPEDDLLDSVSTGNTSGGVAVGVGTTTQGSGNTTSGVTKIEGRDVDPKAKMLLSNIALFAAAFTAPTMVMHCPKISTYIYAGASALYVANEVGLFTRFKTATDLEMAAYLGRGDEESQIDSLETAAKQTRKAVKAAKRRALISKIAAAGYGAASAMAIYENFRPDSHCVPKGGFIQNEDPTNLTKFALLKNQENHSDVDAYFSFKEQMDFSRGELKSASLDDYENMKDQFGETTEFNLQEKVSAYLSLASELLVSSAMAQTPTPTPAPAAKKKGKGIDWSGSTVKLGVLGLGAGAAFLVKSSSQAIVKSKFVNSPYGRAAGFATFAAFSFGASVESSKAAESLEDRANEYDNLANQLRSRINQNISTNGTQGQLSGQNVQGIESKGVTGGDNNDICFTGKVATVSPDLNCDCARTQTCKQPEIPNIKNLGEFSGKSLVVDSLKSFGDVGQDLYNGRLQSGSTKGQSLTKNAARITRLRDSMLDKLNKNREKRGKNPVEFDALQKRFENGLLNEVNKSFNGLSDSEKAAVARFAPGFGADLNKDGDKEGKKKVADDSKKDARKVAKGDVNSNAGASDASKTAEGGNWNFDFQDDEPTEEEKAAIAAALAEEDENYVVEGDISEDRNKNLFNIITRRYLKSAYPVIFEEDN